MKKKYKIAGILAAALCLCMIPVSVQAEEISEEKILQEGYMEEGDGWKSEVAWASNGEKRIYGEFYYPENFDKNDSYPVVIMSHGFMSTHAGFEKADWAQMLAEEGYVGYIFDFCGGSKMSRSDMDFMEMSVMTEVSDLNAVIDFVKEQTFVDEQQIYLFGASQGGLVSALTAAQRKEEIAGLVLLYPALCIVDDLHEQYPEKESIPQEDVEALGTKVGRQYVTDVYDMDVMKEIGEYEGSVLLIHGTEDKTVPYICSIEALEKAYAESASELVLLSGEGTVHGFDGFFEETRETAHGAVKNFLDSLQKGRIKNDEKQ